MSLKKPIRPSLIDQFAEVKTSSIHGLGLVAKIYIPAGKMLGSYEGQIVSEEDVTDPTYVLWDSERITGIQGDNNWMYANSTHNTSHRPNVILTGDYKFISLWPISPGEELLYEYELVRE